MTTCPPLAVIVFEVQAAGAVVVVDAGAVVEVDPAVVDVVEPVVVVVDSLGTVVEVVDPGRGLVVLVSAPPVVVVDEDVMATIGVSGWSDT